MEEDVRERTQEMKAFLLAIEAGHENSQEDYQAFKRKTAAATLAHNKVGKWQESRIKYVVC
jgi:hypothetical protein